MISHVSIQKAFSRCPSKWQHIPVLSDCSTTTPNASCTHARHCTWHAENVKFISETDTRTKSQYLNTSQTQKERHSMHILVRYGLQTDWSISKNCLETHRGQYKFKNRLFSVLRIKSDFECHRRVLKRLCSRQARVTRRQRSRGSLLWVTILNDWHAQPRSGGSSSQSEWPTNQRANDVFRGLYGNRTKYSARWHASWVSWLSFCAPLATT